MRFSRILLLAGLVLAIAMPSIQARSLLQKSMYYIDGSTNKTGQSMFWYIYLGTPQCSVSRKYPGEEIRKFNVAIGLHLNSSGYVEGSGYCAKGPVSCSPTMVIKTGGAEREIPLDSIDCIYDFGSKVRTVAGAVGDFEIDIEGQKVAADRLMMTEYKMTNASGEKELQKSGDDLSLAAISFSKDGIAWAVKTMAAMAKSDTTKPDSAKAAGHQ